MGKKIFNILFMGKLREKCRLFFRSRPAAEAEGGGGGPGGREGLLEAVQVPQRWRIQHQRKQQCRHEEEEALLKTKKPIEIIYAFSSQTRVRLCGRVFHLARKKQTYLRKVKKFFSSCSCNIHYHAIQYM